MTTTAPSPCITALSINTGPIRPLLVGRKTMLSAIGKTARSGSVAVTRTVQHAMQKKLLVMLGGLLSALSVSAQMPVPLLDAGPQGAQARKQLEALLQCKSGIKLSVKAIESQFQALGLAKGPDGVYLPARAGYQPALFEDTVVAGLVSEGAGETKVAVYLASQSGKRMADKLNVLDVDEQANTDDASYFKKTGKKTTLLVGAASELSVGNATAKYQSAVTCQVIG